VGTSRRKGRGGESDDGKQVHLEYTRGRTSPRKRLWEKGVEEQHLGGAAKKKNAIMIPTNKTRGKRTRKKCLEGGHREEAKDGKRGPRVGGE